MKKTIALPEPGPAFKKGAIKALFSILTFFSVYLLLFLLGIGLVALCIYGGIALIIAAPRFITILIGLGIATMGIMVFIFLIKFVFAVSKHDQPGIVEIKETEHPRLFAFIRELTLETNTQFPKKIFISPEVNACVFYNSSFWSMFFPVRKNLQIGLGLVNSLNISEFKAVMAHEFGHFSQKSMKLGSFVYHVNRIIYNMLFENSSYGSFISGWARLGDTFALFASITVKIVYGIQWVLRQMYGVVNKSYLQLSREMEFHADAVAASVIGSNNMIAALRHVNIGDACYNTTLQKCGELLKENKRSRNIYQAQRIVLEKCGEHNDLALQNGMPVVTDEFLARHNLSRLNFKDQWASHPTFQERVDQLAQLNINIPSTEASAWELFEQPDLLQELLSNKIYEPAEEAKNALLIDGNEFSTLYAAATAYFSLPRAYKGFYDGRQIAITDLDELISGQTEKGFDDIFSITNAALPRKIEALENDIDLLKAIEAKNIDTKTFDFDGKKYERSEATAIINMLEKDLEDTAQKLQKLDKEAILFFYQKCMQNNQQDAATLKSSYTAYFELREKADDFLKEVNKMLEGLRPLYSGQTFSLEEANEMINSLKTTGEKAFKFNLKQWIAFGVFNEDKDLLQRVEKFITSDYAYFSGNSFFDNELTALNELANESWQAISLFQFQKFKNILEVQLRCILIDKVTF